MYPSLSADSSLTGNENTTDDLDLRIARVLESTGYHTDEGYRKDPTKLRISDNRRHVAVFTTASLPWMTGTAINPLFRAAYLARSTMQKVTLVVPWLCKSDQQLVYPNNITFSSPEEQETYIRDWLQERLGFEANFKISFYPGKVNIQHVSSQGLSLQFILYSLFLPKDFHCSLSSTVLRRTAQHYSYRGYLTVYFIQRS
jgi:digalactosyldiacylglycerol synthase